MKNFEPIAIIGQGCVLPGCFSPEDLWDMIYSNEVNITSAESESWRVNMNDVLIPKDQKKIDNRAWSNKGGYIRGFESKFDVDSFELSSSIVKDLDPVCQWSFYAANQALKDAGYSGHELRSKTGLIMGNLSYPTRSFSQYFEEYHLNNLFPEWTNPSTPTNGANRFMSGLPALMTSKALGLQGETFAIDAACASSLYALKLAADRLINGTEDMMLVGGVCAADQLFLHVGFTALQALSPSGQSRPFNSGADGLIPSEGAGFIVIKRLKDAIKSGDNILGVIRGIGLSNDGKAGGFLSPAQTGQVKSMKRALESANLDPSEISYIECHATGTTTGDSIELKSMEEVYGKNSTLHLGSLKGNIGHSITASGIGSIIKVLSSMKYKTLPPTPNAFPLNTSFKEKLFSITERPTPWKSKTNRIAAISNFGFGGNNAHILLEEWNPKTKYKLNKERPIKSKVAIVGVEIQSEKIPNANTYMNHLLGKEIQAQTLENISFNAKKLSSPPNDLKHTISQQLLLLHTAENLMGQGIELDKNSTGVFIGMGADAEVNRYGFRKRLRELLQKGGISSDNMDLEDLENTICPVLNAPTVLGTMPNIPANRINYHFGLSGIGFTLSCEELSGLKALDVAINAIQNNELQSAIVGAVDISNEPVHKAALAEIIDVQLPTSDTAVVVLLKNYDEAVKNGDTILATIGKAAEEKDTYQIDSDWVLAKIGYSHTSKALIDVVTAALMTYHRLQMTDDHLGVKPLLENEKGFSYEVKCSSLFGANSSIVLSSEQLSNQRVRTTSDVLIYCYAANSKEELLDDLSNSRISQDGTHRLAIISTKQNLEKQRAQAIMLLGLDSINEGWLSPNIQYRSKKVTGEIAFAFTGAASAYPGMGKELLEEFPGLISTLKPYCTNTAFAGDWIYQSNSSKAKLPYFQLAGSSLMCQVHGIFTQKILGIKPDAILGLSSGETNSMYAMGIWDDMDNLLEEIFESDLYTSALGVSFDAVRTHWGLSKDEVVNWENWRILAPQTEVEALIDLEDRAYVTIINTRNDIVIGGDAAACRRVINGFDTSRVMQLHHDIAIHCSAVKPWENEWRELHTRKVNKVEGLRFYSNYLNGVYEPSTESVADALTGQAVNPIDFPKIVKKAWEDGVRVFIEHGPRNSLKLAISEILRDKDFLAVSIDKFGQSNLVEALRTSAELWSAGIEVNLDGLSSKNAPEVENILEVKFPLHMAEIKNKQIDTPKPEIKKRNGIQSKSMMPKAPEFESITRKTGHSAPEHKVNSIHRITQNTKLEFHTNGQRVESSQQSITQPTKIESAKSVLDLFTNQHRLMSEAHNGFIQSQLQGQKAYSDLMNEMMNGLMGQNFDAKSLNNSMTEKPAFIEQISFDESIETTEPVVNDEILATPATESVAREETTQTRETATNLELQSQTKVEEQAQHEFRPTVSAKETTEPELPGPKFSREQLEVLASGKISSIFGPLFEKQDDYPIQVRMPEPPLLLCDRVTGLIGEPGTLGLGTIYTETDVKADSWYLHNNRMPPGVFIEAGQADLLLISYLGIDFRNKGERSYRLLGCELTFHGELPKPGDTLKYDIHVDGYAKSGDTTLFFFHYDCHIDGKLRISVRSGQAGFFSVKELEESKGVIWNAALADYTEDYEKHTYKNATKKTKFSQAEIEAYTEGRMVECFGEELDWTQTHTRTPRSQKGYQNFIKNITEFDLTGGPAGRGYLKSETLVSPDDWYFKGHFKNDECMPGTLMADACLQMMAFFMVGAGLTAHKDGWRFEPVTGEKMKFICRGQVIPTSKKVTYEIFIDRIVNDEFPSIYAHVLATVDGNKAFLCEFSGLRLIPDWPLLSMPELIEEDIPGKQIAEYKGFKFGYESLINCALGNAENAFGPEINYYNGAIRSPRLPGPPYHFMTRIQEYQLEPGNYKSDSHVVAEYDIPEGAWYFEENGRATMPYAVLMEVALQPCGWFSTFICQFDIKDKDLVFRNLDGNAIQHRDVLPTDKTIVTRTELAGVSVMGEIIIIKFKVVSTIDEEKVFTMDTVFGFFDTESMKHQKGLARTPQEDSNVALENNYQVDLLYFPSKYFSQTEACLPSSKLLMIDRIVANYPEGGKFGKGYIRAEKDVRKSEWFFKAHFFQDPVQPGSLGIEAMIQLIQFYMLDNDLHKNFKNPVFEPICIQDETEWHYRGQVTPDKKLISIDFDVKEIIEENKAIKVIGEAQLWVDGLKIYHAPRIGMRIREFY